MGDAFREEGRNWQTMPYSVLLLCPPHTPLQLTLCLAELVPVPLSKGLFLPVQEPLDAAGNPKLVVWKAMN